MTTTVLTSYIGQGLLAARPATPTVVAGAAALWYSTDTSTLSVYAGGAWHDIVGGSPPTVIQQKAVVNTNSVTLGAGPTQGNLLLAITSDLGSSETAAAGWTKINFTAGANDGAGFFWKIAGVSESATQTPLTGLSTGGLAVFEVANATPSALFTNNLDLSGTAIAATCNCAAKKLILGLACNRNAAVAPSSITGGTLLGSAAQGGSRTAQAFKVTTPASGSNSVTVNYASSQGAAIPMIEVG